MKVRLRNVFNVSSSSLLRSLSLVVAIVCIDQASKFIVLRYRLLPVYFNYNVAFSLPIPWYLPWVVFGVVAFALYLSPRRSYYLLKARDMFENSTRESLALIMMIGGGISNVLDRYHYGAVVDFIDLKFWPVFNIADMFIVSGLLLFLYSSYRLQNKVR